VNTVEEAFRDPQVAEDEMILEIPHLEFGVARQVASPIKISDSKTEHHPGPKLGEHTDEVLRDYLDMSPQEIRTLRQKGAL
jgi:crotonobetainyl-CoA:carnitine CoA-transferase CaiB-like acyl-CoA transferase